MEPITPSLAKILIEKSPLHAFTELHNFSDHHETPAMLLGKAVDALVFGPDKSHGETMPSGKLYDQAAPIADAAKEVLGKFGAAIWETQKRLKWVADGNIPCKGRPDACTEIGPLDLKTASDCSDSGIIKAIEKLGYDIQMAAYCEAMSTLGMVNHPVATLVFVETKKPYDTRIVTLNELMLGEGMVRWRRACITWKTCFETGKWPGRGNMTAKPSLYRTKGYGSNGASDSFIDVEEG